MRTVPTDSGCGAEIVGVVSEDAEGLHRFMVTECVVSPPLSEPLIG